VTQNRGGEHLLLRQPFFGAGINPTEDKSNIDGVNIPDVDFYAAISSSHLMPNAVDLSNEIQGMISHAAMMKGVRK